MSLCSYILTQVRSHFALGFALGFALCVAPGFLVFLSFALCVHVDLLDLRVPEYAVRHVNGCHVSAAVEVERHSRARCKRLAGSCARRRVDAQAEAAPRCN